MGDIDKFVRYHNRELHEPENIDECESLSYINIVNCDFHEGLRIETWYITENINISSCKFLNNSSLHISDLKKCPVLTLRVSTIGSIELEHCNTDSLLITKEFDSDSKIGRLYINFPETSFGHYKISDVTIDCLELSGGKTNTVNLSIINCKINKLIINDIRFSNPIRLADISPIVVTESIFTLINSNLGKSQFHRVDLDLYETINIYNSKIMELDVLDSDFSIDKLHCVDRIELIRDYDVSSTHYVKARINTLNQFKLSYKNAGNGVKEKQFHALEMNEHLKLKETPLGDKLILWFSYYSSNFGQSIWRPFLFNGLVNLILFGLYFCFFNKEGYYLSLSDGSIDVFLEGVDVYFKKLFFPLKSNIENSYALLEFLFSVNSGSFLYNLIRASRKFYH